ncbi:MAG: MmoB/DmpM family protein [Zoogloeaceae bacterium]|nr:MmoB/DmpM family protein [Zoogloeaceae bacterium]MBL8447015.1 MmoB/DmpM family protein [Zoogloeaceae bacterium]
MSAYHGDNIFKSIKDMKFEQTISHQCGVTMNDSVEARAIAELMGTKPGIKVTYLPAMIRIDGEGKIEFNMPEISEALGREMTPHLFEIFTSTHYGRMVMIDDDNVVLFGDMDQALAYE